MVLLLNQDGQQTILIWNQWPLDFNLLFVTTEYESADILHHTGLI